MGGRGGGGRGPMEYFPFGGVFLLGGYPFRSRFKGERKGPHHRSIGCRFGAEEWDCAFVWPSKPCPLGEGTFLGLAKGSQRIAEAIRAETNMWVSCESGIARHG